MESLKLGFSTLGRYLVVIIMSFFIIFSFTAIFTMATPLQKLGYEAAVYENEESKEPIETYVHNYADGDDLKKADYEQQGFIVATREFTGGLTGAPYVAAHTISQIICLVFFIIIIPAKLYKLGQSDTNRVYIGKIAEDKLKGLKASIPTAVFQLATWVCLILGKTGVFKGGVAIFAYGNYEFYGYQQLIFSGADSPAEISWLGIVLATIPVILTVVSCTVGYILGYSQIDFKSKILYKNNEK